MSSIDELCALVHGRIQTIRGMCMDERPYPEIDAKLCQLADAAYSLRCAIEFGPVSLDDDNAKPKLGGA